MRFIALGMAVFFYVAVGVGASVQIKGVCKDKGIDATECEDHGMVGGLLWPAAIGIILYREVGRP